MNNSKALSDSAPKGRGWGKKPGQGFTLLYTGALGVCVNFMALITSTTYENGEIYHYKTRKTVKMASLLNSIEQNC